MQSKKQMLDEAFFTVRALIKSFISYFLLISDASSCDKKKVPNLLNGLTNSFQDCPEKTRKKVLTSRQLLILLQFMDQKMQISLFMKHHPTHQEVQLFS